MLTVEELNSKIQDWQDKDALKKMSKDDLIEVIPCLIDGIKAHSVALEDACKTVLEMSKLLSACAKEVNDPIFGLLLTPFNAIAEASLEKAVNESLAKHAAKKAAEAGGTADSKVTEKPQNKNEKQD